jgi:hypothetical protein
MNTAWVLYERQFSSVSKKLPSLEKEGRQPLGLTGWFVLSNSKSEIRNPKSEIEPLIGHIKIM